MCIRLLLLLQYYVSLRYEKKWTILNTARVASHGVASGCPAILADFPFQNAVVMPIGAT